MVLAGRWVWRRDAGGGRGVGGGEAGAGGRDAWAHVGAMRGVVRVRGPRGGCGSRAARAAGGRSLRLLRGHRRATLGRRRRARLQPLAGGDLADVPRRRLPALPAQHHSAAALHRATRR